MADTRFDLIAAGHIVSEMIYFPDRTIGPVLGSPPAYSLVASATQGTKVGVVTKIGEDFPQDLLETFKQVGIDIRGITTCPTSSRSELIYDDQGSKEIKFPTRADYIKAADVPEDYKNCRMFYVCTMEDDLQLDQIPEVVTYGQESAIDLGGYGGVHMGKKRRGELAYVDDFALEVASHFDFVKASDEDCYAIFGNKKEPEFYAKSLIDQKTKAVLITLGKDGVFVCTSKWMKHVPPLSGNPIDATGGGDTFMAGFLSEYLRSGDILQAAVFGSATALCVIEKTGGVKPERMPTEEQIRVRIPEGYIEKLKNRT